MSSVSENLGGHAAPITTTINGKEYTFSLITQKIKSIIERIIQDRARKELMNDKNDLGDEEFKLAYGAYLDRVGAGAFTFGGPICRAFLQSVSGLECMVKTLANISADEASILVMNYPDQVGPVVSQVFSESFRQARVTAENPGRAATSAS